MDEEKKTGLADAVETGASAAHTIKGAIKAGKAISGAAKGAAAGGPYGAVAGAVWAGRKHIGKIIAVIIILLLLPVLFMQSFFCWSEHLVNLLQIVFQNPVMKLMIERQ